MKGKRNSITDIEKKLEENKEERKKIFKKLCEHVGAGKSIESFSELCDDTIYSYFERFPEEFSQKEYKLALKKGRDWWEETGKRQASGSCLGNSRTWQYNMINRYGWRDRVEVDADIKGNVQVQLVNYNQSSS
jgi:NADH:ubiquinone oxidoreductase subunit F (NADH-binding)